jgi:hypothetical protein
MPGGSDIPPRRGQDDVTRRTLVPRLHGRPPAIPKGALLRPRPPGAKPAKRRFQWSRRPPSMLMRITSWAGSRAGASETDTTAARHDAAKPRLRRQSADKGQRTRPTRGLMRADGRPAASDVAHLRVRRLGRHVLLHRHQLPSRRQARTMSPSMSGSAAQAGINASAVIPVTM